MRIATECPDDRDELAARLASVARAEVAQVLGRTVLLYRRNPKEPILVVPTDDSLDPEEPEG